MTPTNIFPSYCSFQKYKRLSVHLWENCIIVCLQYTIDCHTMQLIFYWCYWFNHCAELKVYYFVNLVVQRCNCSSIDDVKCQYIWKYCYWKFVHINENHGSATECTSAVVSTVDVNKWILCVNEQQTGVFWIYKNITTYCMFMLVESVANNYNKPIRLLHCWPLVFFALAMLHQFCTVKTLGQHSPSTALVAITAVIRDCC